MGFDIFEKKGTSEKGCVEIEDWGFSVHFAKWFLKLISFSSRHYKSASGKLQNNSVNGVILVTINRVIKKLTFRINKRALRIYNIRKIIVFADLSGVAIGTFSKNESKTFTCQKNFNKTQKFKVLNLERTAYYWSRFGVFVLFLKNSYLHLPTDNFATSLITKKGTNKPNLEEFVESINEKSQKNAVKFKISWISRNQNFIAEEMLKTIGYGDWQTTAIIWILVQNIRRIYLR